MRDNQSYGGTDEAERTNIRRDQELGHYNEGDSEVPGEDAEGKMGFDTPSTDQLLSTHRENQETDNEY